MIELFANVVVDAPIQRCFDITRSIDVHQDSSILIRGRAVAGKVGGLSDLGDETTWSARFFGMRFRVRTKVTEMEVPIAAVVGFTTRLCGVLEQDNLRAANVIFS